MWKEFNNHFRNQKRDRGKQVNHHDFLDPAFIDKTKDHSRRTFFSQVGSQSMDQNPLYPYDEERDELVNLGRNRVL